MTYIVKSAHNVSEEYSFELSWNRGIKVKAQTASEAIRRAFYGSEPVSLLIGYFGDYRDRYIRYRVYRLGGVS